MKKNIYQKGFTLVEMLVSISIFITVSTIIITVLFSSLRVSKKSETLIFLKQSGDAAMSQMVREIMYAKSLDDPVSCVVPISQEQLAITSSADNGQTLFSCPLEEGETLSSNSAALLDATKVAISYCTFFCSQTSSSDPPNITIRFTLSNTTNSEALETNASIPFQTSVTMRNFSR